MRFVVDQDRDFVAVPLLQAVPLDGGISPDQGVATDVEHSGPGFLLLREFSSERCEDNAGDLGPALRNQMRPSLAPRDTELVELAPRHKARLGVGESDDISLKRLHGAMVPNFAMIAAESSTAAAPCV